MKNQVIEVLDRNHGKKVIEYWKSKGVDTRGFTGALTKEDGDMCRFYGVHDGLFSAFSKSTVERNGAEIITLPEGYPYPKVMWVWTRDEKDKKKRVVFAEKNGWYFAWNTAQTLEEAEEVTSFTPWKNAKDIQCSEETKSEPVELSDREILSRGLDILAAYVKSFKNFYKDRACIIFREDYSGSILSPREEVMSFEGKENLIAQICEKLGIDE